MRRIRRATVSVLLAVNLLAFSTICVPAAVAVPFSVAIDTSALAGVPANLAFDLIAADAEMNNTAAISGFTAPGAELGPASTIGGVGGALPGGVTLSDAEFFNELLQAIKLGTGLSFIVDLTTNFAGIVPDSLALFILDNVGGSSLLTTSDPTGSDALFRVDLVGPPSGLALFVFSAATSGGAPVPVSVTEGAPTLVPWPIPSLLLLLGATVLLGKTLRRRHPF